MDPWARFIPARHPQVLTEAERILDHFVRQLGTSPGVTARGQVPVWRLSRAVCRRRWLSESSRTGAIGCCGSGGLLASDGALTECAKAARVREISLFDNAGWRADTEEP